MIAVFVWTADDALGFVILGIVCVLCALWVVFTSFDWCGRKLRALWAKYVYRKYVTKQ